MNPLAITAGSATSGFKPEMGFPGFKPENPKPLEIEGFKKQ